MSAHLQSSIQQLKKKILTLGGYVEENVGLAVRAIEQRDCGLAEQVIANDDRIDQMEVEVEEEGLKMLALYQPVAVDLRFIVVVIKINNELERIGDVAVNIAERALFLANEASTERFFNFTPMADRTKAMLKESLDALVNMDPALAKRVCKADDEVDAMNRDVYQRVNDGVKEHPEMVDALVHILGVSRHLERIADLATNIAEDVVYMVTGEIVRHHIEDFAQESKKSIP